MISAVVLTKNEEKNIKECLETLQWCDEIIVVDDNSEDKTVEIAKKMRAKVFIRSLGRDFSNQRNFGLEKAKGDWVLFVDADERVSLELQKEIESVLKNGKSTVSGYLLKREDRIWGQSLKYGETAGIRLIRLGKKGKGKWEKPVHETWNIKGEVGELKSPLFHFPHPTITEFLEEINFYSTLRARQLYQENRKTNLFEILAYPTGKFLKNYLLKLGFLDGMPGFVVALLMSFHSFLVRAKLYLLWKNKKIEGKNSQRQFLSIKYLLFFAWAGFVLIKYILMLGKRGGVW